MQLYHRYGPLTTLVFCLGLSLLLMSSPENLLSAGLQRLARPFQQGAVGMVRFFAGTWYRYLYLVGVQERVEAAERQISDYRRQVIELQEARHERDRLRDLLGFQRYLERPAIAARVIGWDPSNMARSILCDRGSADGVRVDMCVTTADGLVGRVLRVMRYSCRVQLVEDELSNVAGLLQESRVPGIVSGRGADRPLELRYVAKAAKVFPGDAVIASGIGGIYHKGLLIGYVIEVLPEESGLFQTVFVEPSVVLRQVEEVLIFAAAEHSLLSPEDEREAEASDPAALRKPATGDGISP